MRIKIAALIILLAAATAIMSLSASSNGCCTDPDAGARLCQSTTKADCCPQDTTADCSGFFREGVDCNSNSLNGACTTNGCCCEAGTAGSIRLKAACPGTFYTDTTQEQPCVQRCSTNPPPPTGCELTFNALNVKGEKKIALSWVDSCNANTYTIERCKGQGCTQFTKITELHETSYTDVDTNLLWNEYYNYKITGGGKQSTRQIYTGDLECWKKDNRNFCNSELTYQDAPVKTYLINVNLPHFPTDDAAYSQEVRNTYSNKFNIAVHCDDSNKLFLNLACTADEFCTIGATNNPSCISGSPCAAIGKPFGIFSTKNSCENGNYCFYDRSQGNVNKCYDCSPRMSCYDYKSSDSCNTNNCRAGNCEWRNLNQEFGTGVCVDTQKNNCGWCTSRGTQGVGTNNAYNEVFESCTPAKRTALTTPSFDCNIIIQQCTQKCTDFNLAECDGHTPASIGADNTIVPKNPNDVCGLNACKYFLSGTGACKKDADFDNTPDCTTADCENDYFPPTTTISKNGGNLVISVFDIKSVGDNGIYDNTGTTYLCSPQTGKTCTNARSTEFTAVTQQVILLQDLVSQHVLAAGTNEIKFYSKDSNKNLEVVKTVTIDTSSVSTHCQNGRRDTGETAIDCGGNECIGCADGFGCNNGNDCASGNCRDGICQPPIPRCSNGQKDGDESGIDCGGRFCSGCPTGGDCNVPGDCTSGNCIRGKCASPVSHCSNLIKDPGETDVDCGGNECPRCGIAKDCIGNGDCHSGYCTGGKCAREVSHCSNTIKDPTETDIDCGGLECTPCNNGKTCTINNDCNSGYCNNGICEHRTTHCDNTIKDDDETDINCGGLDCPKCDIGKQCNNDNINCISGNCTQAGCGRTPIQPLLIGLYEPKFGATNVTPYTLKLNTNREANCRTGFLQTDYDSMQIELTRSTNGKLHIRQRFTGVGILNAKCKPDEGEIAAQSFEITLVDTNPIITGYGHDVFEFPLSSSITVESNQEVQCKYTNNNTKNFSQMQNFSRYDETNGTNYKRMQIQNISSPELEDNKTNTFYTQCINKVQALSNKVQVDIRVNTGVETIANFIDQPAYTTSPSYHFRVGTNKMAICRYSLAENFSQAQQITSIPARNHPATISNIQLGRHDLYVRCMFNDGTTRAIHGSFVYDNTVPSTPTVDDGQTTIALHAIRASWNSTDNESGIKSYKYAVYNKSSNILLLDWRETTDNELTISATLKEGETYYVKVAAQNNAGLWSNNGTSNGVRATAGGGGDTCRNNKTDGGETDVDCGGNNCKPCESGNSCNRNTDCESKYCSEKKICSRQNCFDDIKNQNETDVDCGGNCAKCDLNQTCVQDTDCKSKLCVSGKCATQSDVCANGIFDSTVETDVDCGSYCASTKDKKCSTGQNCFITPDCMSSTCRQGKCTNESSTTGNQTRTTPPQQPPKQEDSQLMKMAFWAAGIIAAIAAFVYIYLNFIAKKPKKQSPQPMQPMQPYMPRQAPPPGPAPKISPEMEKNIARKKQEEAARQRKSVLEAFETGKQVEEKPAGEKNEDYFQQLRKSTEGLKKRKKK